MFGKGRMDSGALHQSSNLTSPTATRALDGHGVVVMIVGGRCRYGGAVEEGGRVHSGAHLLAWSDVHQWRTTDMR